MRVIDFLDVWEMKIGTAKPEMVKKIMQSGESIEPDLAHEITGKPDQRLTIRQALLLVGCEEN